MPTLFLYIATVLIWGSTWYAIKLQLGAVAPEISVAYRFAIAAFILLIWCWVGRKPMRYSLTDHGWMAIQGLFLFCANYAVFYVATGYLTTGLVAVVFSTIVFWNILFARLLFKTPVSRRVLLGTVLGVGGLALIFGPEVAHFNAPENAVYGLTLCIFATILASLGNITSVRNQNQGLPVLQTNTFGMAYGAGFTAIYGLAFGLDFNFDWSPVYVGSLLYLAIFGSILAFGAYLTLLGRIGAGRAAYAAVLFPVVALTMSVFLEDYMFEPLAGLGVILVLCGNVLALTKTGQQPSQDDPKDVQTKPVLLPKND